MVFQQKRMSALQAHKCEEHLGESAIPGRDCRVRNKGLLFHVCLNLAIIMAIMPLGLNAEEMFFSYVDNLRLRDKPATGGNVLGVLPKGLLVPLVEIDKKASVIDGIRHKWIKRKHESIILAVK